MKRRLLFPAMTLVLSSAMAGCGEAGSPADDTAAATFSISQSGSAALAASILGVSPDDTTVTFGGRHIRRSAIDSLIVVVTRVDVLPDSAIHRCHPPLGDSVSGFRPGPPPGGPGGGGPGGPGGIAGPHGDCGRHLGRDRDGPRDHPLRPDSLVPPDSGWGSRPMQWYSLDVLGGSGRLDLLALPTDTATGLVLVSGTLPVGEYGAARLIVTVAKIWFDTTFTTANGFTFNANTAYDVKLPMRRDSVMGIMTNAGFTIEAAGSNVVLTFDPNVTIGGAAVDAHGNIVIRPVLKPHRGGPPHP